MQCEIRNGFDPTRKMDYGRHLVEHAPQSPKITEQEPDSAMNEEISNMTADEQSLGSEVEDNDMNELSSFDEDKFSEGPDTDRANKERLGNASANPKTIKTYQSHVRVFKDWLRSEGLPADFEYCSAEELSSWLLKFYRDGRRKDGIEWKPSSLKIIRFAINLHLKSQPFNRTISITRDEQFREANSIINERQKELQQLGLDATGTRESKESAKPLTSDDIRQLWNRGVIGIDNPRALHRFAFMIVAINFGITARIGLHLLKPSMFKFDVDKNSGLPYVQYNPRGQGADQNKKATKANRRLFGIPGSRQCPVAALKLYIQKRNDEGTEAFFHTPNRHFKETGVWYTPQPTGKNTLGRLMKDIAAEGNLPHPYTNHSLRYTSPFVLFQAVQGGCGAQESSGCYRDTDETVNPAVKYSMDTKQLLPSVSARPYSRVANRPPPALRKIESNGTASPTNTQSLNGSIVIHHKPSSLVALPVNSSMSPPVDAPPPAKRQRVFSPPPESYRYGEPTLSPSPGPHMSPAGPFSRTARLAHHESRPQGSGSPSAIKAHHVLCVPQRWEMEDILKVLNSGDAIILSRHNLRENKRLVPDPVKKEVSAATESKDALDKTKKCKDLPVKNAYENKKNYVPQGTQVGKGDAKTDVARETRSPMISGIPSSRSSRKQTEPKKLVRPESEYELEDEIESAIAYDEALQAVRSKLKVLERLQEVHTPTREQALNLLHLKECLDGIVEYVTVSRCQLATRSAQDVNGSFEMERNGVCQM
ncbi:uncharacterized protein LOC5522246 [Nematostella vectensis]|uniref:uncharacterized protein LOC5522246 n=1 Tax=Nematostella vectensis TaxID=45351 RepID=UPI0020772584|nr:uncharacterized protein LOC5522246 [Nematostella vectensis]